MGAIRAKSFSICSRLQEQTPSSLLELTSTNPENQSYFQLSLHAVEPAQHAAPGKPGAPVLPRFQETDVLLGVWQVCPEHVLQRSRGLDGLNNPSNELLSFF